MLAGISFAQESGIGVGISSVGINGKYWINETSAIVGQIGSSRITATYVFEDPEMLKLLDTPTPVYYGAGAIIGTHKDDEDNETEIDFGLNCTIGIAYHLSGYTVDIFFEENPTLYLLGGKGLELFNFNLGIRYFF